MENNQILGNVFSQNTGKPHYGSNDNTLGESPKIFFTAAQTEQLEALIAPYKQAGLVNHVDCGAGYESGFFIALAARSRHGTLLDISIEKKPAHLLPVYHVTDAGFNTLETINFGEVLIAARNVMARAANPASERRFSIV